MRVFVAGASGAIGTRLVPQLIDRGHEVIGTCRSPDNAGRVRTLQAEPVVLDLLDAPGVRRAVLAAEPEAIIHEGTALADARFSRNVDKTLARTSRLRTEGTDALLAAAREAGVRRFVAQSFAPWRYARRGGMVKTEEDPLDPALPAAMRNTAAAMLHVEQAVTNAGGIALRYGSFYGAPNDGLIKPVRKRQFPIVGDGDGFMSFIHLGDAATATALALERGAPGRLQHRRRRTRSGARMAASARERAWRQATSSCSSLAGAPRRGRSPGRDGNRSPRRLQRQGQARPRLDAALPELAHRFCGRLRIYDSSRLTNL